MVDFRDLDFDDMPEWPVLPQVLAIGGLIIILQLVGIWFYLIPQHDELEQIHQQEVTLKSSIRIKAAKVAALPQLQAQLDELNTRYQYLLKQLPVQKELASMLSSVNDSGIKNDLNFTRVDWGGKQVQEFLYRLPLNIELTGAYDNIGQFSEAIAKLPRIISLHDVDLQRVSQESSTLHFRVRAYTYQFKPEESK